MSPKYATEPKCPSLNFKITNLPTCLLNRCIKITKSRYFVFGRRHLEFLSPNTLHNIENSSYKFLDLQTHEYCRLNFDAISFTSRVIGISCLWAAILNFWIPFASHNIENSSTEILNLKNVGDDVGILQLSCIQAQW